MRRFSKLILCLGAVFLAAGCPKSRKDYTQGRKAEHLQDYDAAYDYYQKALKADPENAEYLIKFNQARFEASALHPNCSAPRLLIRPAPLPSRNFARR